MLQGGLQQGVAGGGKTLEAVREVGSRCDRWGGEWDGATHPSWAHPEAVRGRWRRAENSRGRARWVSRLHRQRTDLCVHRVLASSSRVRTTTPFWTHHEQCTIGGRAPSPPSMAASRGFDNHGARSTHLCVYAAREAGDRMQSTRDCVPSGPAITKCRSFPCF